MALQYEKKRNPYLGFSLAQTRKQTRPFHILEIYHLKKEISTTLKHCRDLKLFNIVFGTAIKVTVCKVNCNKKQATSLPHLIPYHLHEIYVQ